MRCTSDHGDANTTIQRGLVCLVGLAHRHPRLVLLVALAVAGLSAYAFATRLEYRTQRNDLIGSQSESLKRWQKFTDEFGDDDDMVVVVKGNDPARMKDSLEHLATAIRGRRDRFDRLFYKADLRRLHNRSLLFLPADQIAAIQVNLQRMHLLLEAGLEGWRFFTFSTLVNRGRTCLQHLEPGQPIGEEDEQFLRQLDAILRAATASLGNPADYRNPWHSLMDQPPDEREVLMTEPQYFLAGGDLAFLLVRPVKDPTSFTGARDSVETLRVLVNDLRPDYPELDFGLTGLPVLETDEMVATQHDTALASWLALAGVGLLNLIAFRGLRYPLTTLGAVLLGTAWAMGWLTLTVGHLNILSATFAMMLIGMGDYGIVWVTRYRQERETGLSVGAALEATARRVGPSIATAAATAALAFFAAMLADFQAVTELGWIAGCGVLLCAFATFTAAPALLTLLDRRRIIPSRPRLARLDELGRERSWLPALALRPGWVLAGAVVLTGLLAVSASRVGYDHNLLHLQADGLDSVKWELTLLEKTGSTGMDAVTSTETPEEALALKARFEKLPGVSRVVEVASLVPPDQGRKVEQLRDIQGKLRKLPAPGEVGPPRLPSRPSMVRPELNRLLARLDDLMVTDAPALLSGLRTDARAFRERLGPDNPSDDPTLCARMLQFDERLVNDLQDDMRHLQAVSQPEPITLDDLPTEFRERFIGASGRWMVRIFAKESLWEFAPLQEFVDQVRGVDPEATGKPFTTVEGLRAMHDGFLRAGLYALGVIVLVLLLDFRKVGLVLLALAPLAVGAVLALGALGILGVPLNPANMIALPLVLGVSVNYGVYVVHDYRAWRAGDGYALNRATGRGILVAALNTVLGFGPLMTASHRGLTGLGLLLTLGVLACMTAALLFLPAALRLLRRPAREGEEEDRSVLRRAA